jgi:hypothetical protein
MLGVRGEVGPCVQRNARIVEMSGEPKQGLGIRIRMSLFISPEGYPQQRTFHCSLSRNRLRIESIFQDSGRP